MGEIASSVELVDHTDDVGDESLTSQFVLGLLANIDDEHTDDDDNDDENDDEDRPIDCMILCILLDGVGNDDTADSVCVGLFGGATSSEVTLPLFPSHELGDTVGIGNDNNNGSLVIDVIAIGLSFLSLKSVEPFLLVTEHDDDSCDDVNDAIGGKISLQS
jgi:hypothetical protein